LKIDRLGQLIAGSNTDKTVTVFDSMSGGTIGQVNCGEITTSMLFANNYKHFITSSSEGIIYVWKMPNEL
jgi:hypothetical protein